MSDIPLMRNLSISTILLSRRRPRSSLITVSLLIVAVKLGVLGGTIFDVKMWIFVIFCLTIFLNEVVVMVNLELSRRLDH